MIKKTVALACFAMSVQAYGMGYWSPKTVEASGEFTNEVQFTSSGTPDVEEALRRVRRQIQVGTYYFQTDDGVLIKDGYQVEILSVDPLDPSSGKYRARYKLSGIFQIPKSAGKIVKLEILNDPDVAEEKAIQNNQNLCGGEYDDEFWVYFDLHSHSCPLKEGTDYTVVKFPVIKHQDVTKTYPNYEKMVKTSGETLVSMFFGSNTFPDLPFGFESLNFTGFKKKAWTDAEIEAFVGQPLTYHPKVYDYTKQTPKGLLRVRVFFGESGMGDSEATPFHYFFKEALEKAALVTYDGHAGLGENLNLEEMESAEGFKINLNPGYQVYSLEACFSYHYYPADYFDRKQTPSDPNGTKALDVITTRGSTLVDPFTSARLMKAVEHWMENGRRSSYQHLLWSAYINTYSVDGDEDNAQVAAER